MTKVAWPWRLRHAERDTLTVTEEHLRNIRRLVACWSISETGSAALADSSFDELEEWDENDAFSTAVEIFLTRARFDVRKGVVRNPYSKPEDDTDDARTLLENAPDQTVIAPLRRRFRLLSDGR